MSDRATLRARIRAAAIRFADELADAIENVPADDDTARVTDLDVARVQKQVRENLRRKGRL